MRWSVTLFRVFGAEVRLHLTFLLLLAWVAVINGSRGGTDAAMHSVSFIVLLFLCVLLHELGHVWAASRYGIRTLDVTLLPIGGVASMERMPEKPSREIAVALAGPAVNVVIAFVLILALGARFDLSQAAHLEEARASLLAQVAAANIVLVLFNLIPAFPMDGGRVLRALLATRFGYSRATRISASIGQGIAIVLGFLGLLGNPFLILIALFVFLAASGEASFVEAKSAARGHLVSSAMITSFEALSPTSTVDGAADFLLRTSQREFPVLDGSGTLRGLVTRDAIIAALKEGRGDTPVLEIMERDVPSVPANACLDSLFAGQLQGAPFIAVTDKAGRFAGYLTPENIGEFILVRNSRRI